MKLWTEATAKAAADVLRGYGRVIDALPEISKIVGFEVTASALEKGLKTNGLGITSQYLNANERKAQRVRLADLPPLQRAEHDAQVREHGIEHRGIGRSEFILKGITEAMAKVEPDTIAVTPREIVSRCPKADPCTVWLDISDCQLGTYVTAAETGGITPGHSWDTFLAKLARWEAQATEIIAERMACGVVEHIVIAMLGDITEGHAIFKSQVYSIDRLITEQVTEGAAAFARAFARIACAFPRTKVTLFGVGGNHGRVGSFGETPYRMSWDLMVYHLIELRLEPLKLRNLSIQFELTAWFQIVSLYERRHLLIHGDDSKASGAAPYAGLMKHLQSNAAMMQTPLWAGHVGHFHAEATISSTLCHIFLSGNWIGGSAFSKSIVASNTPAQLAYFFTREGHVGTRRIYLEPPGRTAPKLNIRTIKTA